MSAEVVIVDDDPLVGGLSNDLLQDAGYRTLLVRDSNIAMSSIKENRPRLAILDILMPGIDGLTLLHAIKSDPELRQTRVIVVSGKSFSAEVERAKSYGAELFIEKPYDVKRFSRQVAELIGPPDGRAAPAAGPGAGKTAVRFRVWGKAEPDSTPVVSMEALGQLFILDAGRGIVPLGQEIIAEGRHRKIWLLLSHFHPDHISGLGLFPCLRQEGYEVHILGPREPDKDLAAVLREQITKSYVADRSPVKAALKLHQLREDTYEVQEGLRVSPFYANHPSTTLGYFMQFAGRRIAYCPDSEIYGESATALQDYDEKIGRLIAGSDILIHDARYNEDDYARHKNQGHSSLRTTVEFAAEREIARLILFHQDPAYSDQALDAMEAEAARLLDEKGQVLPAQYGRDGLLVDL